MNRQTQDQFSYPSLKVRCYQTTQLVCAAPSGLPCCGGFWWWWRTVGDMLRCRCMRWACPVSSSEKPERLRNIQTNLHTSPHMLRNSSWGRHNISGNISNFYRQETPSEAAAVRRSPLMNRFRFLSLVSRTFLSISNSLNLTLIFNFKHPLGTFPWLYVWPQSAHSIQDGSGRFRAV